MKFEESDFIDKTNEPKCFIYFLLDDENEVLYVGQTTQGMSRIYQHKDKEFSKVYIILCEEEYLNEVELEYIEKYKPIYNSSGLIEHRMKVKDINRLLHENFPTIRDFTYEEIHKMLYAENIKIYYLGDVEYITEDGYNKIFDAFLDILHGDRKEDALFYWEE